jgi:hypothetical protein
VNQGNVPILTKNIVSGTASYPLDTFSNEIISILRVEVTDSASVVHVLSRLTRSSITSEGLPEMGTPTGIPTQYDLIGKYIYLYPTPNYNSTGGLALYVERNKVAFISTDTTKEPGIPSLFHMYIARYASLPFLIENSKPSKNDVAAQIQQDEVEIKNYFNNRTPFISRMTPVQENNR